MKLKVDKNKIAYKKIKNLKSGLDSTYDWIALKNSIEKYGIKTPLVLTRDNNAIVDGNHRLAIAKLIYNSEDKVPCIYDDEVDFWPNYNKLLKSKYRIHLQDLFFS